MSALQVLASGSFQTPIAGESGLLPVIREQGNVGGDTCTVGEGQQVY